MSGVAILFAIIQLSLSTTEFFESPPSSTIAGLSCTTINYENWSNDIKCSRVTACYLNTPDDAVNVANWALANNFKVRARGFQHGFSPLTVTTNKTDCGQNIVLVNTTKLKSMKIISLSPPAVKVQTGATMEELLVFLEANGYGLQAFPAPGDITVGGALAIGAHGTAIPADGETLPQGLTFGSLSNLIMQFTAVVWNGTTYELRTIERNHVDAPAFLVHLGRTFITEVVLRVGLNYNLRCVSYLTFSMDQLCSNDTTKTKTISKFLKESGRAEIILFPYTKKPWLKVWTISPTKPGFSRQVNKPYNYPFSNTIPEVVSDLANQVVTGTWSSAVLLGPVLYTAVATGLTTSLAYDIWGPSKNTLLYVKPTTLRLSANGYAILTNMENLQQDLFDINTFYKNKLKEYELRGEYPINGALEIRFTSLENANDVLISGALPPGISAISSNGNPEWNIALWFDLLTFPGTPSSFKFFKEIEDFMFSKFVGRVRVEWSKGWAYTEQGGPWTNSSLWTNIFPQVYGPNWASTIQKLNTYDPHKIFSNKFIDSLLP